MRYTFLCSLSALLPCLTSAATIDPNLTFVPQDDVPACVVNLGGDHGLTFPSAYGEDCTSTSLAPQLANVTSTFLVGNFDGTAPTTQTFATAFNQWNATKGAANGGNWVIADGGDLNVTFHITDVASANVRSGGIDPFIVTFTMDANYVGPSINQLVWSQAIYSSFSPGGAVDLNPPANTLDTASASSVNNCIKLPGQHPGPFNNSFANIPPGVPYCDPIYPGQYVNKPLADAPMGPWPDESFRAIALLSAITFYTDEFGEIYQRKLTVYDGVAWGFDLSANPVSIPEGETSVLLGIGLLLGVYRHFRARREST